MDPALAAIQARADEMGIPVEEMNVPTCEPFLSEWCRLHSLHLAALSDERMRGACSLADKKYMVYLASTGDRWALRNWAVHLALVAETGDAK
jgi:hypothetical protein